MNTERLFGTGLREVVHTIDVGEMQWYASKAYKLEEFTEMLGLNIREARSNNDEIITVHLEDAEDLHDTCVSTLVALTNLACGIESTEEIDLRMSTYSKDVQNIRKEREHNLQHEDDNIPLAKIETKKHTTRKVKKS